MPVHNVNKKTNILLLSETNLDIIKYITALNAITKINVLESERYSIKSSIIK